MSEERDDGVVDVAVDVVDGVDDGVDVGDEKEEIMIDDADKEEVMMMDNTENGNEMQGQECPEHKGYPLDSFCVDCTGNKR